MSNKAFGILRRLSLAKAKHARSVKMFNIKEGNNGFGGGTGEFQKDVSLAENLYW